MHSARADMSQARCSYCGYPPTGRRRSLADASIGVVSRLDVVPANDQLTAETRLDPQSGPAAAASAERATSRLGRAAASRGLPTSGAVVLDPKRTGA